ncbi:glycosyltransferase family A protein [Ectobacillus sp. sgz5001026]|uniref:glycosyltransferase family A protein n=1 Tax=Ectobacillus sp. sgz5001026 TaxID=3242473 RepID=UPI0036D3DD8E
MNLQVLVSTMHQKDHNLLGKMNIQSDAIIVNQCDKNEFEEFKFKGCNIKFLSFAERGVGLSRNSALMRSTADICLFADDDVRYEEGYKEIILQAFIDNPKADIILFNVPSTNPERPLFLISDHSRVRWYDCLRYGAVRIAVRTERLKQANVFFSLLFGGGAKYSSGEDSIFIAECIRKGLKLYTSPQIIGYVDQMDSTWFKGYTDKYFIDKGVFFSCLSKKWAYLLCIQDAVRHSKMYKKDKTIIEACRLMFKGIRLVR